MELASLKMKAKVCEDKHHLVLQDDSETKKNKKATEA